MIIVNSVTTSSQFSSCLDLRFKIYSQLGYIGSNSGCDLDAFDWSSIHFAATDENEVLAGTVRLILSNVRVSDVPELESSELWCSEVRKRFGVNVSRSTSIPVLETLRENHVFQENFPAEKPSELSRIIVAKEFRGTGIGRMLSEAVIGKAKELGRDVLFLQCLPSHVTLFTRLGFQPVFQSLNYRLLTVPDRVVAMRMNLDRRVFRC
jgi:GNAT superfamily N-acetyltransferase